MYQPDLDRRSDRASAWSESSAEPDRYRFPVAPRRRVTIKDVAAATGLSPAAVSYALRGVQTSPETQERVRQAAEELGYTGNAVARALARGSTGLVGVLSGSLRTSASSASSSRSGASSAGATCTWSWSTRAASPSASGCSRASSPTSSSTA